jgi:osmoprotectant transport system substrate-binding protein
VPRTVRIAGAPEFRTRVEGFIGLQTVYGLNRIAFKPQRIGTQYAALDSGKVDAADVFTTDGQLSSSKYVVLEDPKNVFGFQNVAPLVRQKVLDAEGPQFAAVINSVSAKLTTPAMQRMNAAVVLQKKSPAAVASQFLVANKLK